MYQQLIDSLLSVQGLSPIQDLPNKAPLSHLALKDAILRLEQSSNPSKKPFLEAMKLLLQLSKAQQIPAYIHTDNTAITADLTNVTLYFRLQCLEQLTALCLTLEDINGSMSEGFDFATGNVPILNAITQSYHLFLGVIKPARSLEFDRILVILRQLTGQEKRSTDELLNFLQQRISQNDKFNQIFGLIWNTFFHEQSKDALHATCQGIFLYCELMSIKSETEFSSWKARIVAHFESNPTVSITGGLTGSLPDHMNALGLESLPNMQTGTALVTQCRYLLYLGIMHPHIEKNDMVVAQQLYSRLTLATGATTQLMIHDTRHQAVPAQNKGPRKVAFSDTVTYKEAPIDSSLPALSSSSASSSSSSKLSMSGSDN